MPLSQTLNGKLDGVLPGYFLKDRRHHPRPWKLRPSIRHASISVNGVPSFLEVNATMSSAG